MKNIYVLSVESQYSPHSRIVVADGPLENLRQEDLLAVYTFEQADADKIIPMVLSKFSAPLFGKQRHIKQRQTDGGATEYLIEDSSYSVDIILFALLTGKDDGELSLSVPFSCRRKTSASPTERWAVVTVTADGTAK